jgi:hypothetical protein
MKVKRWRNEVIKIEEAAIANSHKEGNKLISVNLKGLNPLVRKQKPVLTRKHISRKKNTNSINK